MDAERQIFLYGNKDTKKDEEAYVPGCLANGISEEVAIRIWDKMVDFAKYAFNKSHAAAYAYLAAQTAFLKKFFPVEFMAATMTSYIGNNDKLSYYTNTCQKTMGIEILNPDINESNAGFTTVGGKIRFGLEGIKDVGGNFSRRVMAEREKGNYTSLYDFCVRMAKYGLNKKPIEALIKSGAFDFTGYNRNELLHGYPAIITAAKKEASVKNDDQVSLFDFGDDNDAIEVAMPEIPRMQDLSEEDKLRYEREVTSLYISGNPLNKYTRAMKFANCVPLREIQDSVANNANKYYNRQNVNLGVILNNVKFRITKKGTKMAQGKIQDVDAEADMMAFAKCIEEYGELIQNDNILLAKATIDIKDDGSLVFIINSLHEMPQNDAPGEEFSKFGKSLHAYKKRT